MPPRRKLFVGLFFLTAGIGHLTFGKKFFEAIVPGWVPGTAAQVNVAAGIAEMTGGALALVPGQEKAARLYLVALLLAVFPANIQMAVAPDSLKGSQGVPAPLLWGRLPLQGVAIWWVLRALRDED